MVYQFKSGSRISGVDPATAGAEIERIQAQNGGLCPPEFLVTESRPKSAPLHDYFVWDNKIAGERFRLTQAGHMLRCVVHFQEKPDGEKVQVRSFVPVVRIEGGREPIRGYVAIEEAMSRADERTQVLERVDAELRAIRGKYGYLHERARVWQAIDAALDEEAPEEPQQQAADD